MSILAVLVALLAASGVLTLVSLYLGVMRLLRARAGAGDAVAPHRPGGPGAVADVPGAVRLPRFDLAALRTASSSGLAARRQQTRIGNLRFVLGDGGQGKLEVLAEYESAAAGSAVLPVTVVMPGSSTDYLMIFRADSAGRWIALLDVPGFRGWAEVFVRDARERASLSGADAATVARSVRASPDGWVPAWEAVERGRPEGDPVRDAISRVLRPS